jgi:hypothetical protein
MNLISDFFMQVIGNSTSDYCVSKNACLKVIVQLFFKFNRYN